MNKTNLTVATKDGVSKLIKPKFGSGMLLRAEDLDLLKDYTRDLSRLMFRSLFGCGVVCGLVVEVTVDCGIVVVTVGSGLAIACNGDPIYIPKDVTFPLHDDCHDATVDEEVWIMLCSKEKCCGPRTSICASDEEDSPTECTREKDWWEIRVVTSPPECVCSCIEPDEPNDAQNPMPVGETLGGGQNTALSMAGNEIDCKCADPTSDCYKDHYDGICGCHCGDCSDCECKCVLLAYAQREGDTDHWKVEHKVRRFVRPVLMRDPQVEREEMAALSTSTQQAQTLPRSLKRVAFVAAEESLRREVEEAAKEAAQAAAKKVAKKIGQRAAEFVVGQVVNDVARQAAIDAIAEQAKEPIAAPAAAPAPVEPPAQTPSETPQTGKRGPREPRRRTTKPSTKKTEPNGS